MKALYPLLFLMAVSSGASRAEQAPVDAPKLARHISVLASDAFEGRQPGTEGERRTIAYIAREFAAAGLQPAAGGRWYQPVALVGRVPQTATLETPAGSVAPDALHFIGDQANTRLEGRRLVFAGYGLPDQVRGHRALNGAIVLIVQGSPKSGQVQRPSPSVRDRRDALRAMGAAAVLTIVDDAAWEATAGRFAQGSTELASDPTDLGRGVIKRSAVDRLGAPDIAALIERADRAGFKPRTLRPRASVSAQTSVRAFTSWNVAGMIPGTAAGSETILVMAHWDHLGLCRPKGAADRICNGAVDNASGIAGLIEMARTLAAGPKSGRSILFLATTAEEMGLLGARAYVQAPLRPLGTTVASLNLDTIALRGAGAPVAIVGAGLTTLDAVVERAAAAQNRSIHRGAGPEAYVQRSDAYALLRAGVPSLVVGGVLASSAGSSDPLLDRYFNERYHGPKDEFGPHVDLAGAAEDVALNIAIVREIANPAVRVDWTADAPYRRKTD